MPVDRYQNSTNYVHPQESNLLDLHKSMEYNVLGQPVLRTTLGPTAADAFGRFRVSSPYTLFDSFHRYQDNGKISQYTTGTNSTSTFSSNEGCVIASIGTDTSAAVYRESSRTFSYQPGKSLLVLETFVFGPAKSGLRLRYGYFDSNNGHFLERDGDQIYFVRRTTSKTGSVTEIRVAKEDWNLNKLDGTDASKITLNLEVAQILFSQFEWLGVGCVIQGFVISGEFVPCHRWDWANEANSTSTYMATACLPVRAEIENTTVTTSSSYLKVICASVISEGGYEVRGRPRSVGHAVSSPYALGSKDTVYPIFTMRLKSNRLGAVVLPRTFTIGIDKAANFRYTLVTGGITTGGSWISAGADSSVEYNLSATSILAGNNAEVGYINASNQASISPTLAAFPFQYQLERNSFTGLCAEFTVCIETDATTGPKAWCSLNWEEVT